MGKKSYPILVINPGSTSTKLSLFEGNKEIWKTNVLHSQADLAQCHELIDQYPLRRDAVLKALKMAGIEIKELAAIISRGAPLKSLPGGTYHINDKMLDDLKHMRLQSPHISFVGGMLARELSKGTKIPVFIADPISVDELEPLARYTGLPGVTRRSLWHALNCRAAARQAARKLKKDFDKLNLLVVHLGSGITVAALKKGKAVDVANANSEGPFSPERTGDLPAVELMEWMEKNQLTPREMIKIVTRKGGMVAHLGTADGREVEERIKQGDKKALEVFQAMAYQIGKQVGALAAVLKGNVDAIVITGGLAKWPHLVKEIKQYIAFIAQVLIVPGEEEMEALALAALRVLEKKEKAHQY